MWYELHNAMHTLGIKLNELIAIYVKNQLQTFLFKGIKLHCKVHLEDTKQKMNVMLKFSMIR